MEQHIKGNNAVSGRHLAGAQTALEPEQASRVFASDMCCVGVARARGYLGDAILGPSSFGVTAIVASAVFTRGIG